MRRDELGHVWVDAGRLGPEDDCAPIVRCLGCGTSKAWPLASRTCSKALPVARETPIDVGTLSAEWRGKLRDEPPRPCKRCRTMYLRPLRAGHSAYCGPRCARVARQGRSRAEYAARKTVPA